jgi:hypothetical protein
MPTCWRCNRDLGPMREHQKMVTEKGPICYGCFNALQEEAYQTEQARRAPEQKDRPPA